MENGYPRLWTLRDLHAWHACGRILLFNVLTEGKSSQVSLLNFIQYNVVGGGESSLYGVESWPFYLINGALNFGVALPAALLFAPVATMGAMDVTSARVSSRTAWAVAPLYVWLAAISALPHKEERFLYVVYPQVQLPAYRQCGSVTAISQSPCSIYGTAWYEAQAATAVYNICSWNAPSRLMCADLPCCKHDVLAPAKILHRHRASVLW